MTHDTLPLQTLLKANGYSLTLPRKQIFAALQEHGPLTMADLIRHTFTAHDRSSVYRTVSLYERLGVVQRIQVGWKYRIELSDQFQPHHHHMFCVRCGATVELPEDNQLEARLRELASKQDFQPQEHQIEIKGLCGACMGK